MSSACDLLSKTVHTKYPINSLSLWSAQARGRSKFVSCFYGAHTTCHMMWWASRLKGTDFTTSIQETCWNAFDYISIKSKVTLTPGLRCSTSRTWTAAPELCWELLAQSNKRLRHSSTYKLPESTLTDTWRQSWDCCAVVIKMDW